MCLWLDVLILGPYTLSRYVAMECLGRCERSMVSGLVVVDVSAHGMVGDIVLCKDGGIDSCWRIDV